MPTPKSDLLASDGKVVAIYYTLRDARGEVLDSNRGKKPLAYLHGRGSIVRGLERALEGKAGGASLKVEVAPADGYGEHDPAGLKQVKRSQFPPQARLEVGVRFAARGEDGQARQVRVHAVDGDTITIDLNHPLAGQALHFEVTVAGVREASAEEREHGHVHGPGGHEHGHAHGAH